MSVESVKGSVNFVVDGLHEHSVAVLAVRRASLHHNAAVFGSASQSFHFNGSAACDGRFWTGSVGGSGRSGSHSRLIVLHANLTLLPNLIEIVLLQCFETLCRTDVWLVLSSTPVDSVLLLEIHFFGPKQNSPWLVWALFGVGFVQFCLHVLGIGSVGHLPTCPVSIHTRHFATRWLRVARIILFRFETRNLLGGNNQLGLLN